MRQLKGHTVTVLAEYSGYEIKTPGFEGPLDLLLFLVKNYEINIYDIPITLITEQFLAYIRLLKRLDLEVASEFIVMAAHLMYIKSRMLLPADPDIEDEDDPRSDLVNQLLEYQKFKEAAESLEHAEMISREVLERKPAQILLEFPDDGDNWIDVKLFDLVNAFSRLIAVDDRKDPVFPVLDDFEEEYDSEEKIEQIRVMLDLKGKVLFQELLPPDAKRGIIIVTFLALLHMIKRAMIDVKQHKMFGDITIFPRQPGAPVIEATA